MVHLSLVPLGFFSLDTCADFPHLAPIREVLTLQGAFYVSVKQSRRYDAPIELPVRYGEQCVSESFNLGHSAPPSTASPAGVRRNAG